ncbi:MAG: arsenite methyltransferase [Oligoflexia bacterium]|nr:arsenite methyltransferase [Oligoflexia bacterium]
MEGENLKSVVKEKYGEIAKKSLSTLSNSTCCGTQCCGDAHDYTAFSDDYTKLKGYNKEADLKLGCGIPTEVAAIKSGDVVLDLGSGAGNDAFVARALVGDQGRVIGIDMTEPMIEKARQNVQALGYSNVEFRLGDIEQMPVESSAVDVVISNCVLNLVPDKEKAFSEIFRVLKCGGHFSVSDIVLARALPQQIQEAAEMYAGCVSGAILKSEYLGIIEKTGFRNVEVKIEKPIHLPLEVLSKYLAPSEAQKFQKSGAHILSITVYGEKLEA